MDITAEHFETLQRINNMKKDQDVAENLDVEARIHERIAEMVRSIDFLTLFLNHTQYQNYSDTLRSMQCTV